MSEIVTLPNLVPAGESGAYLAFGTQMDRETNQRVHRTAARLRALKLPGVTDVVPGYASLYIEFDVNRTGVATIGRALDHVSHDVGQGQQPGRLVTVPVCYGEQYGPDLEQLSRDRCLSPSEIIGLHSDLEYQVFFMGFTPGFAFMGMVDERIASPRLQAPRVRVPAGSVGIAGTQTGIYPVNSPGGWRLIGRTPLRIIDLSSSKPWFLLRPGDRVRFVPILETEFSRISGSYPSRADSRRSR